MCRLFLRDERGQAMTGSAGFLACCAMTAAGAWYFGGAHVQQLVDLVMNSAPPGTSDSLFH